MRNDFYTYAWLREDGTPYYIGKGRGNRAFRKGGPDKSRVLFLKINLTEQEAFKHERYMIFVLGRKDSGQGILWNFTDGGEGVVGLKHSAETKKRISKSSKGRKLSKETREKLRQQKLGNEWNRGRKISEKQKEQISKTLTGVKHTDERRRNQSLAKIGVKLPPERRKRQSLRQKGLRWWNDGETQVFSKNCPEGFQPGMIKRTS